MTNLIGNKTNRDHLIEGRVDTERGVALSQVRREGLEVIL